MGVYYSSQTFLDENKTDTIDDSVLDKSVINVSENIDTSSTVNCNYSMPEYIYVVESDKGFFYFFNEDAANEYVKTNSKADCLASFFSNKRTVQFETFKGNSKIITIQCLDPIFWPLRWKTLCIYRIHKTKKIDSLIPMINKEEEDSLP